MYRALCALLDGRNHLRDLLGGIGGTLGQLAHLIRHHGEAAPLVTGPRRFDRRIQRQQIGLCGDVTDHPDDGRDLPGAFAQLGHSTRRVAHRYGDLADFIDHRGDDLTALTRQFARAMRQCIGLARVAPDALDADGHFFDRRRHARCGVALALRGDMDLPRGGNQAARRVGDMVGVVLDAADQPAHGVGHVVEAAGDEAQLVARSQIDMGCQIASGEPLAADAQAADAGHHRQIGTHREIADHRQHHQQHGQVAEQHLSGVFDTLFEQAVQAWQQHVAHLRIADADRLGGDVEELRRRGAAEVSTHHHVLHHRIDHLATFAHGGDGAAQRRLEFRPLGNHLVDTALHVLGRRLDLLGQHNQRSALRLAHLAPGQYRRRTTAQAAQPLDQKRHAANRGGHQVIGLRLGIEGQAVGVRHLGLEVQ